MSEQIKTPWGTTNTPGQGITNAKDPGPVPEDLTPASKLPPPPAEPNVLNDPATNRAIAEYEQLERADHIYRRALALYAKKLHEYRQQQFWGKSPVVPYFGASFAAAFNGSNLTDEVKNALPFTKVAGLYEKVQEVK
jgi:hypothetical protein